MGADAAHLLEAGQQHRCGLEGESGQGGAAGAEPAAGDAQPGERRLQRRRRHLAVREKHLHRQRAAWRASSANVRRADTARVLHVQTRCAITVASVPKLHRVVVGTKMYWVTSNSVIQRYEAPVRRSMWMLIQAGAIYGSRPARITMPRPLNMSARYSGVAARKASHWPLARVMSFLR